MIGPSRRALHASAACGLAFALALVSPLGLAQEDRVACRSAFEKGQELRDDGKLTAAREELVTCTRVCPVAFATPCEGWLADVEKSLPTIVPRAVSARGQDLTDVTVSIDGVKRVTAIDGRGMAIDPGAHEVRFEVAGRPPVTEKVVIVEGEKNRVVLATIDTGPAPSKAVEAPTSASAPVAAWIVSGLGIVAIGGFAYFGLTANAQHDELVRGCSRTSSCSQGDKDGVVTRWHVADAMLASGVVLLGVGAYLFLTHDGTPDARPASEVSVGARPTPSGASAELRITF